MDVDEAIDFANQLIHQHTGKPLNDSEIKVFRGSWQGLTYAKIDPISPEYLEKDVGFKLWQKLSQALEVKIGKKNFRGVIEAELRKQRSHSEPPPKPQQPQPGKTVSNNTNFLGREKAIADLNNLVNQGAKVIIIQAEGGIGKTTLARNWFELKGLEYLELRVGTTSQNLNSVEDWVRQKLRNYFKEIPGDNFFTMLEQLKERLESQPIGILIDNLEPALINGEFIEPHRSYYVELLTVLTHSSVQPITLITSREPLYESAVKNCQPYPLDGLELEAWQQYFENRKISIDLDALIEMHRAYGGNAEAMSLLSADILKESKGDLKSYWHNNCNDLLRHRRLEDLVQRQFDKLKNDNLQAYELLRRFGYYPDRDVLFVPKVWLFCLLWDVPEKRRQRIVDALRDRCLIKFMHDDINEGYYLHPVIRAEAVEKFDLEKYNQNQWLLIKREIDVILASNKKLQAFLTRISFKSFLVAKEVGNSYKSAAIRAFYFETCYLGGLQRWGLNRSLGFESKLTGPFALDKALIRSFIEGQVWCVRSICNRSDIVCSAADFARTFDVNACANAFDPALKKFLEQLRDLLPDFTGDRQKYYEWWSTNGLTWINNLLTAINYRNLMIIDSTQYSEEDRKSFKEYYQTIWLLVDCLKAASNVTPEVRSHIEDTLLLPIAEIEKRKLGE
jgi:hypothetical protein